MYMYICIYIYIYKREEDDPQTITGKCSKKPAESSALLSASPIATVGWSEMRVLFKY